MKPDNILITEDLKCKIGDFGGAAYIYEDQVRQKAVVFKPEFTPAYAAPERHENASLPAFTFDIYSFGLIIFFILAGKDPETELHNDLGKKVQGRAESVVQSALAEIMKACCRKESNQRPKMEELFKSVGKHYKKVDPVELATITAAVLQHFPIHRKCPSQDAEPWIKLPQLEFYDDSSQKTERIFSIAGTGKLV